MVAMSLLSVVSVTNVGSGTSGGGGGGRLNGLRITEVYRAPLPAPCAPQGKIKRLIWDQRTSTTRQFIDSFTIAPMTNLASPNTQIVSKSLYKKHT